MLHLSNKGSKKSYAAKAACLTAGLVAVFASSSVFADRQPICKLKDSNVNLDIQRAMQPGTYYLVGSGGQRVQENEATCAAEDGTPLTVKPFDAYGAVRFSLPDGSPIPEIRYRP